MKRMASDELVRGKRYFEQDMSEAQLFPFAGGEVAIFSKRSPSKATACEDSAAIIPFDEDSGVLVVADGLGGQPLGDQASFEAIERLEESLHSAGESGLDLRDAILNGIEAANRSVGNMAGGAATTLAIVEIQGRLVRPYHVGDSTILAVGQRGKIKLQTVSHSPVGYAVEAGFLDQEEAMHHEERHLISNMIGSSEMHITVGPPIRLADRDTLLVASDGVLDNLHEHEIVECIRKGPLEVVAKRLADDCLHRMNTPREGIPSKPDDITYILFRPAAKQDIPRQRAFASAR